MSDDAPVSNDKDRLNGHNSAIKNIAVVQCDGFRCLAYRDVNTWRDFRTGKELPEVRNVVFTFSV